MSAPRSRGTAPAPRGGELAWGGPARRSCLPPGRGVPRPPPEGVSLLGAALRGAHVCPQVAGYRARPPRGVSLLGAALRGAHDIALSRSSACTRQPRRMATRVLSSSTTP